MTDKPEAPENEVPESAAEAVEAAGEEGAGTSGGDAESEVDSEMMDLQYALAAAEKELTEHREAMLRMQAEMENLRKRLIRDLERSRLRALEGFMADLLPVRDSLERGLETDDETATVEAMKEGKALIIRMLNKVLEDHGLVVIDPQGEPFNPELHEAMTVQPSAEHAPNTVLDVLEKGFQLHQRLIRPARVVVSCEPRDD